MSSKRKTLNYLLIAAAALFSLLLVSGCARNADDDEGMSAPDTVGDRSETVTDSINRRFDQRVKELTESAPPGLDICRLHSRVSLALDTLIRWPQPLLNQDEACVLATLDSLAAGFIASGRDTFLVVLDTLAIYSGGHVHESIDVLAASIFKARGDDFLRYLFERRQNVSPLQSSLIVAWTAGIDRHGDTVAQKVAAVAAVRDRAGAHTLPPDQQMFLSNILREAGLVQ